MRRTPTPSLEIGRIEVEMVCWEFGNALTLPVGPFIGREGNEHAGVLDLRK